MKLLHFAFSTIFTTIASLTLIPAASAVIWSISGSFDDGGNISGTFNFDEDTETYSNINLETTVGSTVTVGNTYNSNSGSLFLAGEGFTGLTILDEDTVYTLNLEFNGDLLAASSPISLTTNTSELDDLANERFLTNGTVSVAVPLEFSPTLGLLLASSIGGVLFWKKRTLKS